MIGDFIVIEKFDGIKNMISNTPLLEISFKYRGEIKKFMQKPNTII